MGSLGLAWPLSDLISAPNLGDPHHFSLSQTRCRQGVSARAIFGVELGPC